MAARAHRRRVRRGNAFATMIRRSIRNSLGRFFAIIGIVALGCGFFAGLQMSGPDMRIAADDYYDGAHLWDIRLISTLGFSDDDVDRIRDIDGIDAVMPSISTDVMMDFDDEQTPVRINLLPESAQDGEQVDDVTVASDDDDYLNRLILRDGRWPTAADECVLLDDASTSVELGDTITVLYGTDADTLDGTLGTREFTVVGTVSSANYPYTVSFGSTTLGSGMIHQVLFTPRSAFADDAVYTEIYATVDAAADYESGSDEYERAVAEVTDRIEDQADDIAQARLDDLTRDAQQELDEQRSDYEEQRDDANDQLADALDQLEDAARQIADGESELADGQAEYDAGAAELATQRASAQRQIDAAQQQIDATLAEINTQQAALDATSDQIDQARTAVTSGTSTLLTALNAQGITVSSLDDAADAIASAIDEIDTNLPTLNRGISQAQSSVDTLTDTVSQLESTVEQSEQTRPQLQTKLDSLNEQYSALNDELTALQEAIEQGGGEATAEQQEQLDSINEQIATVQTQIDTLQSQIDAIDALDGQLDQAQQGLATAQSTLDSLTAQRDELKQTEATLTEAQEQTATLIAAHDMIDQYDAGQTALNTARQQVAVAQSELDSTSATAAAQIAAAQAELDEAAATLAEYREQLAQAQAEYEDGMAEYEEQSAEVEEQLADAETQLADAQAEIDDLEAPDIYILDRTQSEGAASYEGDSERIDSIADLFPFLFFLVAALVALTTMTRMVEDERVEIGTYKALGYSTAKIASKYLAYAAAASVAGAVVGIVILSQILPYVIMQAYGIIYAVPSLSMPLPILPSQALFAGGLGVAVTLLSTWFAVVSSLRETPARLMVPRPPKAGKRILLEHVGPLWRHLSFSWKVTCRNIFRYKKRFFMTIIGVSGCTALMLVGFGLHDSIWDIIDNQYGPIQQYDIVVSMDGTATQNDVDDVEEFLVDHDSTNVTQVATENMLAEGDDELGLQVVIPEDANDLTNVLTFRERVSQDAVPFDDDAVLVTEKAATTLGLDVGDTITLHRQDSMGNAVGGGVEVIITGVVEYYVGNAVFVGPDAWADIAAQDGELDADPTYDTLFAVGPTGDEARDDLSEELLATDHVSTVTLSETAVNTYTTMLSSIDMIVVVLIVSAAALAFIVLINLTNINIGERVREIATLKVLGFTRGEVNAYIFREVAILSLVGDLLGLALGRVLEGFVITTVEVSAVMFGRSIHVASYLYAFALTMAFTVIVVLVMRRKLDNVDMVESLKSVD